MRRNRPLAEHYPIRKPATNNSEGHAPRHDEGTVNHPLRSGITIVCRQVGTQAGTSVGNVGGGQQNMTALSRTTSAGTGPSTLHSSPQPRRPVSLATESAWPSQPGDERDASFEEDVFAPPSRSGGGRGAAEVTAGDHKPFYSAGSLFDLARLPPPPARNHSREAADIAGTGISSYHARDFRLVQSQPQSQSRQERKNGGPPISGVRPTQPTRRGPPAQYVVQQLPAAHHVQPSSVSHQHRQSARTSAMRDHQPEPAPVGSATATRAPLAQPPSEATVAAPVARNVKHPTSDAPQHVHECHHQQQQEQQSSIPSLTVDASLSVHPSLTLSSLLREPAAASVASPSIKKPHRHGAQRMSTMNRAVEPLPGSQEGFYADETYTSGSPSQSRSETSSSSFRYNEDTRAAAVNHHTYAYSNGAAPRSPPRDGYRVKSDHGFMTPPCVRDVGAGAAAAAGHRPSLDPDIRSYFQKRDVFAFYEGNIAHARARARKRGALLSSPSSERSANAAAVVAAAPRRHGREGKAKESSVIRGFIRDPSASVAASSASNSKSHGHDNSRSRSSSASHGARTAAASGATVHPYAVDVPRAATHTSLFRRHRVKESRVLQSYIALRQRQRQRQPHTVHTYEVSQPSLPPSSGIDEVPSRLSVQERSELQQAVAAAECATASAAAATAELSALRARVQATEASQTAAPTTAANTESGLGSAAVSVKIMAELIQSIVNGPNTRSTTHRMEDKRASAATSSATAAAPVRVQQDPEGEETEGPCSTLISHAGDPLALSLVVNYLKQKASRLRDENKQLWNFLHTNGPPVTVVDGSAAPPAAATAKGSKSLQKKPRGYAKRHARRWRHKRCSSESETGSRSISGSGSDEGSSEPSTSSSSPSRRHYRRRHTHHAAPQLQQVAQPHPLPAATSAKVESIERTASRPPLDRSHASSNTTTTNGRGRVSANTGDPSFPTPPRDPNQQLNATALMSPSLSSSTTVARSDHDGGEASAFYGHRGASPRRTERKREPAINEETKGRSWLQERYSFEKDQLYSFMHALEEEEEAAVRAGRGSDYGFNDAPFFHPATPAEGRAGSLGSSPVDSDGVLHASSMVGPPLGNGRVVVPSHNDAATSTGRVAGDRPPPSVNASSSSRVSSASGRHHKHVQTSVKARVSGAAAFSGDEDPPSERERDYNRRWRRGGGNDKVLPHMNNSSSNQSYSRRQNLSSSVLGSASGSRRHQQQQTSTTFERDSFGDSSMQSRRTSVITLHTSREYTRRTVQRLQAYVNRLEDTRQTLRDALNAEDTASTSLQTPVSGRYRRSPANGVPPLYPQGGSGNERSSSVSGGRLSNMQANRFRPRHYFRSSYSDPEVDATLDDMEETDPIDVKIVLADDGTGSVSKQVVDDGESAAAEFNASSTAPSSTVLSQSAWSTPRASRHRATSGEACPESPSHRTAANARRKRSPRTYTYYGHNTSSHSRSISEVTPSHVEAETIPPWSREGTVAPHSPLTRQNLAHLQAATASPTTGDGTGAAGTGSDRVLHVRGSRPDTYNNPATGEGAHRSFSSLGVYLNDAARSARGQSSQPQAKQQPQQASASSPASDALVSRAEAYTPELVVASSSDPAPLAEAASGSSGVAGNAAGPQSHANPLSASRPGASHGDVSGISASGSRNETRSATMTGSPISVAATALVGGGRSSTERTASAADRAATASTATGEVVTAAPTTISRGSSMTVSSTASARFGVPDARDREAVVTEVFPEENAKQQQQQPAGEKTHVEGSSMPSPAPAAARPPQLSRPPPPPQVRHPPPHRHGEYSQPDGLFSIDGLLTSPRTAFTVLHQLPSSGSPLMGVDTAASGSLSNVTARALGSLPASAELPSLLLAASFPRRHPSSVMAIDRDEELYDDGLLSSVSPQASLAALGTTDGSRKRGSGDSAASVRQPTAATAGGGVVTSPQGSPTPSPPRQPSLACIAPASLGRGSSMRSIASPRMDGEDDDDSDAANSVADTTGDVTPSDSTAAQNFFAARSVSPMSATQADALTSP